MSPDFLRSNRDEITTAYFLGHDKALEELGDIITAVTRKTGSKSWRTPVTLGANFGIDAELITGETPAAGTYCCMASTRSADGCT